MNPRLIIVDPLEEVKKVMDRNILNDVINAGNIICLDNSPIKTPSSVLLNSEVLSGWMKDPSSISLKFPLICKPVQACGTRDSHQMMILTGPQSISELLGVNQEWIAQEFLNHNATIYKVYVIGDFCEVTPRLSLPDFPNDYSVDECIHFNSHDPIPSSMFSAHSAEDCKSPIGSEKPLMQRKGISRIASIDNTILNDPNRTRSPLVRGSRGKEFELWNSISTQLRDRLKLDLFGYDVIIHSESGLFYVVDINYFPSYKNISQFPELLLSYLLIRLSGSPFLYKQFI
jgi:inositol-1,3,4-trisphosphate 5/6-kinase/inositol-tetrakisphosphate 1-kinase